MRFFQVLDLQIVFLAIFFGLAALLILYVAFSGHVRASKKREPEPEEYPDGIRAGHNPIPPLLIFVYVGFALWALGYVIVVGILGRPF